MTTYQEIKRKKEKDYNELFTRCGVFWAFSRKQFDENKTPLLVGEKYVDIGAGGYIPKHNLPALLEGIKAIDNLFKLTIAEYKMREKHILYELNNHECFYTGNITSAVEALDKDYTLSEVTAVYEKYKAKKYVKQVLESDYITK